MSSAARSRTSLEFRIARSLSARSMFSTILPMLKAQSGTPKAETRATKHGANVPPFFTRTVGGTRPEVWKAET